MVKRSDREAVHPPPYWPSVGYKNAWNLTRTRPTPVHVCEACLGARGTLLLPFTNYTEIFIPYCVG
jgi:hypothetical protein